LTVLSTLENESAATEIPIGWTSANYRAMANQRQAKNAHTHKVPALILKIILFTFPQFFHYNLAIWSFKYLYEFTDFWSLRAVCTVESPLEHIHHRQCQIH
jgi:hypothetical protein